MYPKESDLLRLNVAEIKTLRALIVNAVHESGRLNGWQNSKGITSLSNWEKKVKDDGVFDPPWLYRWVKAEIPARGWKVESLIDLAKIMAHYGVMIEGVPMPEDYFVVYSRRSSPSESSPAWIREACLNLSESDQLEILSWLAAHFAHAKRKALAK